MLARSAGLIALFFLCSVMPLRAAEVVGEASSLRPAATQAASGDAPRSIAWKDQIFKNAQLATTDKGALEVTFLDRSKLSMGPNSSMTIDEFVYSGANGNNQELLKYTKGAFRFISGAMSEKNITLQTPTATIGIRGTIIRTLIQADGSTIVGLDQGSAVITSTLTGQIIQLTAGEKITIKPGGELGTVTLGKVEGCD